ncbi:MAG: ABC transporter substrate-binding protein [Acidihalobacter sp.]
MNMQEPHSRKRGWLSALLLGATLCICGLTTAAASTTVKFGVPPWPGVTVKTEVARQLLEAIGYQTAVTNAGYIIDLQGVSRGEIDADMAIWLPSQGSTVNPLVKSGKIKLLIWKAGVHSIGDLQKYSSKFDSKIYGIESGNDGNQIMIDAIKNDTYNLKGWQLVPSSTAGMLAQAGRAIQQHKWIVFLGWKPHWMNIKYKLRYLKDPKMIWGGPSTVYTAVNPEFVKKQPNVARFLKQMVVYSKAQSQWIYDYGYKKQPADAVAKAWIKSNMGTVAKWLKGVKTADGSKPAIEAVKTKFAS